MGRVALALEEHVQPGTPARWMFVPKRDLKPGQTFADLARELELAHPVRSEKSGGDLRITSGVVPTNDPERASAVLTLLAVGEYAAGRVPI